jgi:hypothetical protein
MLFVFLVASVALLGRASCGTDDRCADCWDVDVDSVDQVDDDSFGKGGGG